MNGVMRFKILIIFVIILTNMQFNAVDALENTLLPTKNILREYQEKVAFERCVQQVQDFCPILIEVLHELFIHLEYWKTQELTPLSYFLSKDPSKWIYRKQEWRRMDSCKALLAQEQEHNAHYLGLFRQFLQDPNYSEQNLIDILDILESCLNHYPCKDPISKVSSVEDREACVDRNEGLIKQYKKNAKYAVAHCSKPNHFQRNWLSYFLGTTALAGMGYFVYKNKSHLQDWANLTLDAAKKFYEEHVSSPILKALRSLFDQDGDPLTTKEAVDARQVQDIVINKNYFSTYLDLAPEEMDQVLNQVKAKNHKALLERRHYLLDYVLKPDTEVEKLNINKTVLTAMNYGENAVKWLKGVKYENSSPSVSNQLVLFISKLPALREIVDNFYIEFHNLMLQKEIATLEMEKIRNAQAINAELAAILPSALLVFVCYSLGKKLFTSIVLQKNTYQPLRRALRNIHRIYNKYQVDNQNLSVIDRGYSYYWIEQFKHYASQINLEERTMILEDLSELESCHYKPSQKLQTIQRMYYNYTFLLPTES